MPDNMGPMTNVELAYPLKILTLVAKTGGKYSCFGHWLTAWRLYFDSALC